jgi:hypothetical protein
MKHKTILVAAIAGILGGNLAMVNVAQAFNMGNMMSPNKWFNDNDNDRYYRRYGGYGRGGGYGPYGGGYGPYGGGYGPYGGGYGPYGGGGYGGYNRGPSTIVVNPQPSGNTAPRAPR